MEFVLQRRSPVGNFAGLGAVVIFHFLILLAFMHGLARDPVAFTPLSPIDWVRIIEPVPPPPKQPLPKLVAQSVAPVEVPQPEVIDIPPVSMEVITPSQTDPSTAPVDGQATAKDSNQGATLAGLGAACPNAQGVRSTMRYPAQARREGLQGDVVARFLVAANGQIRNINIVSSSNRAFNNMVMNAVKQFSCVGQGREVTVEVPFSFKLD